MSSSGITTLSASGFLLPDAFYDSEAVKRVFGDSESSTAFVVTVASVVESFLSPNHCRNTAQVKKLICFASLIAQFSPQNVFLRQWFCFCFFQGCPQLIPGAQINILMEVAYCVLSL